MGYHELVKERLHIGISTEEGSTYKAIRELEQTSRQRGMHGGGQHLTTAAEILTDGLEQSVMSVLDKLREESMSLPPSAFSELWDAAKTHLAEQVPAQARQRQATLKSTFEQTARVGTGEEIMLSNIFGQRTSNLMNAIHHRIEECVQSYNYLVVPSRQTTKDLLKLVGDVSDLLKAHGDVAEFIKKSAPQLERIETEVRKQGVDVMFAADALTAIMGDKLTNKGAITQLLDGIKSNAAYDGIKIVLTGLAGYLSQS